MFLAFGYFSCLFRVVGLFIIWLILRIILSSCSALEASGVKQRNIYMERKNRVDQESSYVWVYC